MKLYYSPGACSLSPHIVLRESGLKFDLEKVNLKTKKTETGKDYFTVSPNGYVPALEIAPGDVLAEGPAIVQYIADQAPAANLAPANGTRERYTLQSWLNFVGTELHKNFSPIFNPATSDEAKAQGRKLLEVRYASVEKHLAGKDYLLGANYSVADVYLFVTLTWTKYAGIDLSQWPALSRLHDSIAARPAVQAALKAEGLLK
ncbi:MAG: glutathione transferase GstA [Georgfuchsia sp.]